MPSPEQVAAAVATAPRSTRRHFVKVAGGAGIAALAGSAAWYSDAVRLLDRRAPVRLGIGRHLFVDDLLVGASQGVTRAATVPVRRSEPILSAARFGVFTPYLTVTDDREWGTKRLWYNRGTSVWHAESADGVRWGNERVAWELPRAFGASVIDDRAREANPARRFKVMTWQSTREFDDTARDDGGLYVGFSGDGLQWSPYRGNPLLKTWPEGYGRLVSHCAGDIADVFFDPIRNQYTCALKLYSLRGEMPLGPKAGTFTRRLVGITTSPDFIRWERPRRIFVPDSGDTGLTEFYGMAGTHAVGDLLIGFLRVLRDDLPHEPGAAAEGIGYTVLAYSRDGVTWTRDRTPFLDRNPNSGTWDRAMAWVGAMLPDGDELSIYYGGYAQGHKVAPDTERQIGLARMVRDRYVARTAGVEGGTIRTPLLELDGDTLTVNAAVSGTLRAVVRDADGRDIPGFGAGDCRPVVGDSLAHRLEWREPVRTLRDRQVQVEFQLRAASLYGVAIA